MIKITSFLLLALWLPATLHCDLEAAGFGELHHDSGATTGDCETDICATVESALIKESVPALNLAAPAANLNLLQLASLLIDHRERQAEPILCPRRQAPPPELATGWQFITRAAPLSRAPSSISA